MPKILWCVMAIGLANGVCLAAKGKPQTPALIGQIVQSSGATVDGGPALSSGTVLAGDTLATSKGGGAIIRIPGGGQVNISENTTVGFRGSPGHVVAKIAQGEIVVQGPNPEFLVIEAAQCRIQPAGEASATSAVTMSLGGSATVTAQAGSISVVQAGSAEARTLTNGETFVCPNTTPVSSGQGREESKPAAGEQAGQASAPPESPKHSNTALWVLLLGGGAAAGIGAAAAAGGHGGGTSTPASPSAP